METNYKLRKFAWLSVLYPNKWESSRLQAIFFLTTLKATTIAKTNCWNVEKHEKKSCFCEIVIILAHSFTRYKTKRFFCFIFFLSLILNSVYLQMLISKVFYFLKQRIWVLNQTQKIEAIANKQQCKKHKEKCYPLMIRIFQNNNKTQSIVIFIYRFHSFYSLLVYSWILSRIIFLWF